EVGKRTAVQLLDQLSRQGTLDLVAVHLAPPVRIGDGPFVPLQGHVVAAGLRMELNPVVDGRTADQLEELGLEVEQDDVADDISIRRAGYHLLSDARLETLEA